MFGGLFVAGCEAPTVSPDAVSCSKTGDAAKHSIASGNRPGYKIYTRSLFIPASVWPIPLGRIGFYSFSRLIFIFLVI